jgi:pentapeptide MXKDX repeat protein
MKIITAVLITTILAGGAAYADDNTPADTTTQHSKAMKDCMAQQKATNGSQSKDEMKKTCMAQVRTNSPAANNPDPTTPTTKGNPSPATASPTNPPQP